MPPPPPTVSHLTNRPVPDYYIHADSAHFRDTCGRSILLRGVNLSGAAKSPPSQPGQKLDGFWENADKESYVGQPLNLDDGTGDVHLARLRAWGFNMIRFVFTWEALEHEGPGKYDYEYMDYVVKVLRRCKAYGFKVFMDPHQDVWSRFSGGSGAPLWTLYACGFNPRNLTVTNAAFLQNEYPTPSAPRPEQFPHMIWSTNYTHLASMTLFTLFYAGKDFAPKCQIDGVNIQEYLQGHFFGAVEELAKKIAEAGDLLDECVIGWDSMNEPGEGMVGREDLSVIPAEQALKMGPTPTPFEGFRLGMGEKLEVDNYKFGSLGPSRDGKVTIDPKGAKVWLTEQDEEVAVKKYGWKRGKEWQLGTCIWALHDVWDPSTAKLLRKDYFATRPSDGGSREEAHFVNFYFRIHWLEYAELIRRHHPEAIHFVQPPVFKRPPELPVSHLGRRACLSPHYYDGLTLLTRHWNWFNADALGLLRGKYKTILQAVKIGESAIRNSFQQQLGILKGDCLEVLGHYPTLIGEIGIPFDMDGKKAYGYLEGGQGEGDYSAQQKALDAALNACDGPNNLNYTMWTYVPSNSHQWGDNWNGEDLSIWSEDDTERAAQSATYSVGQGQSNDILVDDSRESSPTSSIQKPYMNSVSAYPSSTTLTMTCKLADLVSPAVVQSGSRIPPELINDGARASAAFCRPFPIATVGRPLRIDFDIASSVFKLQVDVCDDDEASEEIMTEIYLPFVHYSSSKSPLRSIANLDDSSTLSLKPLIDQSGRKLQEGTESPSTMELDVDITASHGHWETDGQLLRWWYVVPSNGSETFTIEVKRRGGAIPRTLSATSSWWDICPQDACSIQ